MIKVIVTNQDNSIDSINVNGHALSNEYGKDLVCAGVSAIMYGFMNSFPSEEVKIIINDEEPSIIIKKITDSQETNTLFKSLLTSLKTIEQSNNNFIKIKEI